MKKKISLIAVLLLSSLSTAALAGVPPEFRGLWAYGTSNDGRCKLADHPITKTNTDDEGVMAITTGSTLHSEWGCNIASIKEKPRLAGEEKLPGHPITVDLACSGEGENFKEREVWSLQRILQNDALVVHNLSRSTVSVLLRCQ